MNRIYSHKRHDYVTSIRDAGRVNAHRVADYTDGSSSKSLHDKTSAYTRYELPKGLTPEQNKHVASLVMSIYFERIERIKGEDMLRKAQLRSKEVRQEGTRAGTISIGKGHDSVANKYLKNRDSHYAFLEQSGLSREEITRYTAHKLIELGEDIQSDAERARAKSLDDIDEIPKFKAIRELVNDFSGIFT